MDAMCLALNTPEVMGSVRLLATSDSTVALDAQPGGRWFCVCKKATRAFGDAAIPNFDFGIWGAQKGFSLFPAACIPPACGCGDANAGAWSETIRNLTVFNINANLHKDGSDLVHGNQITADAAAKLFPPSPSGGVAIDIVSLTTAKDFRILFEANGMMTWFKHIAHIRSVTFITKPDEFYDALYDELKKGDGPAKYRAGAAVPGTDGAAVVPPIHVVNEAYFTNRYRNFHGCPYAKVCQQLMKLHVFDIPNLLDNVLILDSDTAWGAEVDFVAPNGSAVLHQFKGRTKTCDGNDPINFVNGMLGRNDSVPLRSTGKMCRVGWCPHNDPLWPPGVKSSEADGFRHISHHMLFQRDLMQALHDHVKATWKALSLWASVDACWKAEDGAEHSKNGKPSRYCTGRVAEYELYWTFVNCHAPARIIPRTLINIQDYDATPDTGMRWEGASSTCTPLEMAKCVDLYKDKGGFLLKGCHNHRANLRSGMCLDANEIRDRHAAMRALMSKYGK